MKSGSMFCILDYGSQYNSITHRHLMPPRYRVYEVESNETPQSVAHRRSAKSVLPDLWTTLGKHGQLLNNELRY